MDKLQNKKGMGTVSFVIGITVVVIVVASVAIPIVDDALVNLTGTEATVLGFTGTLLAVLVIALIAKAL